MLAGRQIFGKGVLSPVQPVHCYSLGTGHSIPSLKGPEDGFKV